MRRVSYRIDAASASALINQPGEYRVAVLHGAREGEIELAVIRGAAELVNDDGRTPLRAGERALCARERRPVVRLRLQLRVMGQLRSLVGERGAISGSASRRNIFRTKCALCSVVRTVWRVAATTPRTATSGTRVSPSDWRPYYRGRWVTLRPYGWTWVGVDPWAWPTHHYGRWGFSAGAWFWIPGRSWGPAWVSWAYAPGYVSWCPLGWNNRPVFQIVNINRYGHGYDPWRAWTAVPRRHFGVDYVNVHYVAGRTFDARTRQSFVPRSAAPEVRGYAVPRSTAPIRAAGTAPARRPKFSRVHQSGARRITRRTRRPASDRGPTPQLGGRRCANPRGPRARSSAPGTVGCWRRSGFDQAHPWHPSHSLRAARRDREPAPCLVRTRPMLPRHRRRPTEHFPIVAFGLAHVLRRRPQTTVLGPTAGAYRIEPPPGSVARPANRPYGSAVPRAPQSAGPAAPEAPVYGVTPRIPRTRRALPPLGLARMAARSNGGRRGVIRSAGPPPAAAPPASRSQPGASAPPPEQHSAPTQARPRGGAQSSGTAVPRGRGR